MTPTDLTDAPTNLTDGPGGADGAGRPDGAACPDGPDVIGGPADDADNPADTVCAVAAPPERAGAAAPQNVREDARAAAVSTLDRVPTAGGRLSGTGPQCRLQAHAIQDEALARATWSRLAEPADHAACALVGNLGAGPALAWLLDEALDCEGSPLPAPRPPIAPRGDAAAASAAWSRAAARWAPRLTGLDIRRELDALERLGGSLILPTDPWWPIGLDDLEHPPHCLWVRGDPALLPSQCHEGHEGCEDTEGDEDREGEPPGRSSVGALRTRADLVAAGPGTGRALALVGARASTDYGERMAARIASDLTTWGVVVVSGGAFGIDAAAHRGALRSGPTLSVSAGGVDRLYPTGNADLLHAIIDTGALVAEVPPGCRPGRHRFLTRNRLIAALSEATVVVEAAWRSGALSTARHARDLGRGLGAVPGPVTSMESVGCHRLLRDGAVCITDAEDALELVAPLGSVDPEATRAAVPGNAGSGLLDGLTGEASMVVDALPARGAATVGALARVAGLSEQDVVSTLGLLELSGRVERDGSRWRRRAAR